MSSVVDDVKENSTEDADSGTDMDFDKYKGDHESIEHWELRKNFMMKNQGRVSEPRLLCLRYPQAVMDQVAEYSVGIVEEYRNNRKSRLQRTFVKASDAAERKTKKL